jgi:excisionase family DNA binding protein
VEKIYTIKQVAEYCHVSKATVWRWLREKKLKYFQVGGKKMITESDLKDFIGGGNNGSK